MLRDPKVERKEKEKIIMYQDHQTELRRIWEMPLDVAANHNWSISEKPHKPRKGLRESKGKGSQWTHTRGHDAGNAVHSSKSVGTKLPTCTLETAAKRLQVHGL